MIWSIMRGFGGQAVLIERDTFGNVTDRVILPESKVEEAIEEILAINPDAEVCVA
jgi:hypothetical protein